MVGIAHEMLTIISNGIFHNVELKRKGFGYERIAKALNCTVYRVRQCLADQDPIDEL